MHISNRLVLAIAAIFLAHPVLADRLSDAWQSQRDYYNEMVRRICAGDREALGTLITDALDNAEAVALNNLAWVHASQNSCSGAGITRDDSLVRFAYRESANFYYPIGMFNYGRMLFEGRYGTEPRPRDGLSWLELSAQEGYARGAEELALIYAEGRGGIARDIQAAEAYLETARRLGLTRKRLANLTAAVRAGAASGNPATPSREEASPDVAAPRGEEIFEVNMEARHAGNAPRLGDRTPFGNVLIEEVVYIAQAFDVGETCWRVSGRLLIGKRLIPGSDFRTRVFDDMLAASDEARRKKTGFSHGVFHFTDLDEGVAYHRANPRSSGTHLTPLVYTLAEAKSRGARCANDTQDVLYPEPVRAGGF